MVLHTLAAFAAVARLHQTWVVVAAGDTFFDTQAAAVRVAHCGGATRAQSVLNGLGALQAQGAAASDWVLVHDAARCLVTPAQIDALIDACQHDPVGGLLALPLPDTLKQAQAERVAQTVDRRDKWLAQTPQMFRLGALQQALAVGAVPAEVIRQRPDVARAQALGLSAQVQAERRAQRSVQQRLASLTERERDVMKLVIDGKPNKLIADALDISVRTVEVHRARVFDKMGVKSAVELTNALRTAGGR